MAVSAVVPFSGTATQAASTAAAIPIVNAYGQPIPRLWGRTKVRGWPLWSSLPVSSTGAVATASTLSFALGFGYPAPDAVSVIVSRLWVGGQIIYDISGNSAVQAVPGLSYVLYTGTETQGPDPTIVAVEGPSATPGFRGLIYVVFKNFSTAPYGGMLPEIDAEIVQAETITSIVTPYFPNNMTHSGYKCALPDYVRNELIAFGTFGAPCDVFDLATSTLKYSVTLANQIGITDNDVATPVYKNKDPYFYSTNNGLSNSEPVLLMSYSNGAVMAHFGTENSGTVSTSSNITYSRAIAAGPPLGSNDDLVTCGTLWNEIVFLERKGTALTWHSKFSFSGTLADLNDVCAATIGLLPPPTATAGKVTIPVAPAVDYTKFSVAYFTHANKIARAVATSGSASQTVISVALATGSTANPTFFANQFAKGTLAEGIGDLITLGTNEIAEFLFTGPPETPWVSAIIRDTVTFNQFLRVYDTAWSRLGLLGYSFAASIDMSVFTQRISVQIPIMDTTNYARTSKHQFALRPGSYILGYASGSPSGATFITLDVSNGQFSTFVTADTTLINDADDTIIYTRPFAGEDLYDSIAQCVFYPQAGGTIPHDAPIPGKIVLREVQLLTDGLNVGDYLKSLCITAGYDSADVAAIGLENIFIQGSIVNVAVDLIALLSQICAVFRIDIVESDGVIKFQKKPRNADLVIDAAFTQDDVAPIDQSSTGTFFDNNRDSTQTLPALLSLEYLDGANQNAIGAQTAKRTKAPAVTTASVATLALSVPIIMSAAEALFWATYALFDMWNGAKTTKFRVSQKWSGVECGDYLSVSLPDGSLTYFKTSQVQVNADFSLQLSATAFAQYDAFRARAPAAISVPSLTTPTTSGGTPSPGTMPAIPPSAAQAATPAIPSTVTTPSPTTPDVVVLDNVSWTSQVYQNISATVFAGADIPFGINLPYRWFSRNKNTLHIDGHQHANPPYGPMGSYELANNELTSCLGNATLLAAPVNPFEFDFVNSVTVKFGAALANITLSDHDWLGRKNLLVVGDIGRWEVILFRDVTDNGDGSYTFAHLIRGVLATEAHCGDHTANDFAVFLDMSDPNEGVSHANLVAPSVYIPFPASTSTGPATVPISKTLYAGPYSTAIDRSKRQDYIDNGRQVTLDGGPIKPWSPVNVTAVYSGSDIVLTWKRRDRAGGDLVDGTDVETSVDTFSDGNHFEIDIWNGSTIKRTLTETGTLTSDNETVTYHAADIATDGFTSPTRLHVTVYQISPYVGRGWPHDITVDVTS